MRLAGHAVAMEYLTMINSTHCERVFALSDRLQKALCQGTQEFLIPKTLNPYLRVHENGTDLDEVLAVGGMLDEVTKALLRKERRDAKIQGADDPTTQSKKDKFRNKPRLRRPRVDRGKPRGPQKKKRVAAVKMILKNAKALAGMKRGSGQVCMHAATDFAAERRYFLC